MFGAVGWAPGPSRDWAVSRLLRAVIGKEKFSTSG